MRFDILTLFPDFFSSPMRQSVIGRAVEKGILDVRSHDIRDYATDKHRTTDDYPYGGGHGMVMKVEPVALALEAVKATGAGDSVVVLTSPQGVPFMQRLARALSGEKGLIIVCGRYEGVDERIRTFVDIEISAGDYIMTGGEIAALAIMDAVGRLVPGVLGEPESAEWESFSGSLLEYPQYTRPEEFRGMKVPGVLLSGNHGEIDWWRRRESIRRTFARRPDLLLGAELTEEERGYLEELRQEGLKDIEGV